MTGGDCKGIQFGHGAPEIQVEVVAMRHNIRGLGISVVMSLLAVVLISVVTAASAAAQVSQPDYGAGPGVGAGAPLRGDPPGVLSAQPVAPGVRGSGPGVGAAAPAAPGVQGMVPATTLPRTGGDSPAFTMSWQLAALGALLVAWLSVVGMTHARAEQSA